MFFITFEQLFPQAYAGLKGRNDYSDKNLFSKSMLINFCRIKLYFDNFTQKLVPEGQNICRIQLKTMTRAVRYDIF